jgi:response regulator of citrate/malate metabolism
MTTALDDSMTVFDAHAHGCTQYLVKPIEKSKLVLTLQRLELM